MEGKMARGIFRKNLLSRIISVVVILSFIFTSMPLGVYASWGEVDKLRTESRVMMDGGDEIELDLLIEDYKNKVFELHLNGMLNVKNLTQILESGPVYTEGAAPLIDLVKKLTPENINKDYLLKIISTAIIEVINSNAKPHLFKVQHPEFLFQTRNPKLPGFVAPGESVPIHLTPGYTPEALLIDLSVSIVKETLGFINKLNELGLRFRFEPHEISKIENSVELPENIAPRGTLLSLLSSFKKSQEQLSLADGGEAASFLRIIAQDVHKGKGSSDVGLGLTIGQLVALINTQIKKGFKQGLMGAFLGHTATRQRYMTEAIEELVVERDFAFTRLDEFINDRIKELLGHEEIKEIHLGVGSDRKYLKLEEEIEDIEKQLTIDFHDIALANLQRVNFDISYEPSIDIKPLEDERLVTMVQQVHQEIYKWFTRKYGDEEINSIWGKKLKVLFRGSVIKDKDKDNATPIMSVKVKTKEDREIPGVHGVVFATSGKEVKGCLEVAKVVEEAARRDNLQYVVIINLKSIETDDKDRTPPDEYVDQIYAALTDGRLDPRFIIPEIVPPDVELKEWLDLVAKAEAPSKVIKGTTSAEMRWQMVKQSALYYNNNLALTDIEARRTALSSGHPTVEARYILKSKDGQEIVIPGEAASGASAGKREALFLFDGTFAKKAEKEPGILTDEMIEDIYGKGVDRKEALRRLKTDFEGKGVEIALWIARNILIPELKKAIKEGKVDPSERYSIDRFMIEYEKTHGGDERQKLKLTGGNTTAFSTAAAKLGAAFNNMAPWEFLSYRPDPKSLKIDYESFEVLIPMPVQIEGGEHGNWNTDWQEYLCEVRGNSFDEIMTKLANITFALEDIMKKRVKRLG